MGRMPPRIPNEPQLLVISVPHSGTRTLVKHLGIKTHQHFNPGHLKNRYGGRGNDVHIPIRNPIDVAESWARRMKPIDKLVSIYGTMFHYLDHTKDNPTLHKMEDLPRLAGTDDWDRQEGNLAIVHEYKDTITDQVIKPHIDFFSGFYQCNI